MRVCCGARCHWILKLKIGASRQGYVKADVDARLCLGVEAVFDELIERDDVRTYEFGPKLKNRSCSDSKQSEKDLSGKTLAFWRVKSATLS
jgi:hypothetical protein